jgi:30S ribosomal protein S31
MTNVGDPYHPNRLGAETQAVIFFGDEFMGKGDKRTKRGKIFRGTFGKRRPKPKAGRRKAKAASAKE